MPQKKRVTKSRKHKKSNLKKGKVKLPVGKVIGLCIVIICVCMALLLVTTTADTKNNPKLSDLTSTLSQRFEKESTKGTDPSPSKTSTSTSPAASGAKNASSGTKGTDPSVSSAAGTKGTDPSPKSSSSPTEKSSAAKSSAAKSTAAKSTAASSSGAKSSSSASSAGTKTSSTSQTASGVKNTSSGTKGTDPSVSSANKTKGTDPSPSPVSSFNFPQAVNSAQLIFVFDDGGQNLSQLEKFMTLPFQITVAVLPQIAHSAEAAQRVRKSGNEVILHQPMQSVNPKVNPGPGAITPDMDEEQIKTVLYQNVNQIAPIAGMNNHEGSAITADAEKMAVVMQFAAEQSLYFLDSRTNVETKVPYVAEEMGYSYYERNIFLDNEKTRENVLKELNKGLVYANKNGSVIMIGHIWSADFLPQILQEVYPELKAKGYTFSVVSKSKAKK